MLPLTKDTRPDCNRKGDPDMGDSYHVRVRHEAFPAIWTWCDISLEGLEINSTEAKG